MNKPKVSIIVPVYNAAEYLDECLNSIRSQTFEDFEVICFNDASTDNSLEILNEYASLDSRFHIIDSKINIKQGGGRNRAIKAATAPFVMFVDSDDWVSPAFVEALYTAVTLQDADIATADYCENLSCKNTEICLLGKNLTGAGSDLLKRKILEQGCRLWASIIRKSIITDNNLYFPEHVFYEDNAVGSAIFLSARKIVKIDDIVYYYRQNPHSTTKSVNDTRFFDRIKTSVMMLENARKADIRQKFKNDIEKAFIRLYYINTIIGSIFNFTEIPFHRIKEVDNTVTDYVDRRKVNQMISELPPKLRLLVRLSVRSPFLLKTVLQVNRLIKH